MMTADSIATERPPVSNAAGPIYRVVFGVGIVCSLAIVSVHELTQPIIEQNRLELRRRAITAVLEGTTSVMPFRYETSTGQFEPIETERSGGANDATGDIVFAGYSQQGRCTGVAVQAGGMGYQDRIEIVYGYSSVDQCVIGMEVLQSRETPGLGDRIETDPEFLQNFQRLDVRIDTSSGELAHPIEFVNSGEKTEPWQIDGITGATISSRAISEMLRDSTQRWIPLIQQRLSDFELPEKRL